ncbi:hypothetical protein [Streptomyces lunalinharesii]|uniref:Uncharacterized protein n=1 Tax=Streptomyces lunalinharesii TaxID=333384 RepID=A0ABN3T3P5_9ACTN
MQLTASEPRGEGSKGRLSAWVGQEVLEVDFFCWSAAAHERALHLAGFDRVSWIRPEVSDEGTKLHGSALWRNYLANPHALILDSVAGPYPGSGMAN